MGCTCSIVPNEVLRRLAQDTTLSHNARQALMRTALIDQEIRKLREQARELTITTQSVAPTLAALAATPTVTVYNCNHTHTLPGSPVPNPGHAADPVAQGAFTEATAVAQFYQQVFNRNSIDNAGMTILSSIHYGVKYNNAGWNGTEMLYGDGDGEIFVDFTGGNDVIGHELTHGVTQYTLQLAYVDEPGGLNESVSDVFGSMFRQWQANQDVNAADWLIGSNIIGPAARAKGFTCLRDMTNPAATHCLAPQPTHFSQYHPGMDPHFSSGIPNLAFYTFAKALGDPRFPNRQPAYANSWQTAGQIWYYAMTNGGASPRMSMHQFANRTHAAALHLYPNVPAIDNALRSAWTAVGV